ncbi:MAG: hypothetical protein RL685_807 [Pseudomonadota bacterium]|jgi:hypothetical protein
MIDLVRREAQLLRQTEDDRACVGVRFDGVAA